MCSCDSGFDCEFYYSEYRRARKAHECSDCYKQIPPGSLYEYCVQKWEGDLSQYALCLHCIGLRAGHHTLDPDCNPTLGDLRECIEEAFMEAHLPVTNTPADLHLVHKFRAAYKAKVAEVRSRKAKRRAA